MDSEIPEPVAVSRYVRLLRAGDEVYDGPQVRRLKVRPMWTGSGWKIRFEDKTTLYIDGRNAHVMRKEPA